jgi:hypothetical protein
VPESTKHIMLGCPRREYHRHSFGTVTLEFSGFVRHFATSHEDINALLLGGVPPSLHVAIHLHEMGGFFSYGAKPSLILLSLYLVVNEWHCRNVLIRESDLTPRITRMARRPYG